MVNIDATTPQLKVLKELTEAIASGNIKNIEPLLSKDFTFRSFPKTAELPDLTKEGYIQRFGAGSGVFNKIEATYHELIEAPGKLVAHHSFLFTTADGTALEYDAVAISTFVDEDGQLKLLDSKEFTNPEQRGAFYAEAFKALSKGNAVA